MLISEKVCAALNEQVGNEFSAMLQYLAIAAHFERVTLPMMAGHFFKQAEEEKAHAHKFLKYIVDIGGDVRIPALPAPQPTFQFAEDAVKLSLEQEKRVTQQINHLLGMAKGENDYVTDTFLQWFVQEQLEEVRSMEDLLSIVQRAGEGNLLRVEEYLARAGGKSNGFGGGNGSAD
jgi:ferritin